MVLGGMRLVVSWLLDPDPPITKSATSSVSTMTRDGGVFPPKHVKTHRGCWCQAFIPPFHSFTVTASGQTHPL